MVQDVIRKRASLVICAIDDFSDRVVSGSNIVVSAGCYRAQRKADGYYVFINLPVEGHIVTVQSDIYHTETIQVDMAEVDVRNPIMYIRLKPNTVYPVPQSTACIRGCARIDGLPAGGLTIVIEKLSDGPSAKIAEDSAKTGSRSLKLYKAGNAGLEGMEFIIDDKEGAKSERVKIIGTEEEAVLLEKPLKFGHKRGTVLIPYAASYTDSNGCFAIPVRQQQEERVELKLHFQMEGANIVREVSVAVGETLNLGTISLRE